MNVQRALAAYGLAIAILGTVIFAYNSLMPVTTWFEYESVNFVRVDGKSLRFRSVSTLSKKVDIGGEDTLFCDVDGDGKFQNYSRQPWTLGRVGPRGKKAAYWNYHAPYPPGAECHLRSLVGVDLQLGVTRHQLYEGETFRTPQ